MARRRLKVVALLLLAWSLADLSVPGICQSDEIFRRLESALSVTALGQPSPLPASDGTTEDDCFCCCSHIVPTPHFKLEAGIKVIPEFVLYEPGRPTSFHSSVYHPPRY